MQQQLELERKLYRRVTARLIPFLFLCYIFAYVDRVNVGFAKLQMQQDLHMSDAVYGTAAGIFFIGYFFFEIPCNLMLQRIGAKRWLGPIMIVWGVVSACTMLVQSANQFYALRFALGLVESGFFPGVILYLTFWFPARYRAKMIAAFMTAIPLSGLIGGPVSGWILEKASAVGGLRGWQWLYIVEAAPSILAGIASFIFLDDNPGKAKWLSAEERAFLEQELAEEHSQRLGAHGLHSFAGAFTNPKVWALCFIYFGLVMGNYGLGFWLPQIVKETLTKDPFQIGLLTAIPWSIAAVAMILVGHHSDKTGERRWHIAIPGTIGAAAFALSSLPGIGGVAGLLALTIATAGIITACSTFWALPTSILSGTAAASGIALVNSVGNLAGYVSPAMVGYIRDATHHMAVALWMLAAFALAASLVTVRSFGRAIIGKRDTI